MVIPIECVFGRSISKIENFWNEYSWFKGGKWSKRGCSLFNILVLIRVWLFR